MLNDPYRTVLINIFAAFLLLIGLLINKYIYPKKEISLFKILILISILPLISLLRPGDYESGDFNIHIYRIMTFYDSLKEGNIMPSWAGELNATYGNPLFIFNYSFPYYIISLLHLVGLTFISSMKIYLGASLFLSGIFMYLFVKELTNNKLAAFTSAIFYLFNPYHLIDVHFRATLGESTIFTLAPLALFFLLKYLNSKKTNFLILTALTTAILLQAHPLVGLTILGIMILFTIYQAFEKKGLKEIVKVSFALLLGIISSLYLWLSFIIYAPYTYPYPSNEMYFYPFSQLFYSPWKFGLLFQGHYGELALIIGYTQIFIVFLSIIALLKHKISKKIKLHLLFWLFIFFFFLFLMNPASIFIWKFFPVFWFLTITGRLLLPIAITSSIIAGYIALNFSNTKIKKQLIYILLTLTIGSTILNWGHRTVIPGITDDTLRKNVWKSTLTEGRVAYFLNNRWADFDNFWFSELPKQPLEIIQGKASVKEISRTSTKHTYIINAHSPITVKENTLYFPGWSMTSNYQKIEIYPGKRGVINARLPDGLQKVELEYKDLAIFRLSKIISIGVLVFLVSYLLWKQFKK